MENPLDTTTDPTTSLMRRIEALTQRVHDLELGARGVGTIIASSYEEAKKQLPAKGADGQLILARGWSKPAFGVGPVLFIFDAVSGEGAGSWWKVEASEA